MIKNTVKKASYLSQLQRLIGRTLLTCALLAPSAFANTGTRDENWQTAPALPYPVQEIYPVHYRDYLIVAGGLYPNQQSSKIDVSKRVVIYDLNNKTWLEGPELPEPRHHPMLVVVEDRLLSFGGFVIDQHGMWHNSKDVLELVLDSDPAKDSSLTGAKWVKIADMPKPLAETLSATQAGKVHLVTGRTPLHAKRNSQWIDQVDVSTHYIFDPTSLSWSTAENAPTARNSGCSVTTGKDIHTIAGRTVSGGNLASHEAFNFASKKWRTLAPLPQAQGGLACASIGNNIYVFGGEYFDNGGGVYREVWQYDIEMNTWSEVNAMPDPRHGLGAVAIEDQIFVIAGGEKAGGGLTSAAMTIYSPRALTINK